ncbi:FERM and PDZ domain-containing protein 4,FERM and PDZ domain-containing protein 3,FERM and PDZ domain-containing protein 1 [Mytilus coruscus]|uniref:FERM and PDZ domain-containing protein 4,FERM and PDZ domain-containing protein 3,FERM and PDZ domain-containing protein 1 n=1 Tax=Mytilus coruscus TaxID=42192 RepID=A0A6J8ERC5_MYTCO|nr:FERM and PDZ domain-containing protein 4,FERM and PDZ domain-containing protein 3,FERM and PDZ domain-containing protein 1 [Mytilus coruscus]
MIDKVNSDYAITMSHCDNILQRINNELPDEWEAKLVAEQGRIYYLSHTGKTSSWVPPTESWDPGSLGLPHGWECAVDKNNKPYFINHLDKYTTRDDPRDDPDYVEPPKPREVELDRDPLKGFGFVAGSERPVVVRFVTDGGPSIDKLLPGDQIIRINGEDVKKAPREYVIDCVRSCKDKISLTVCQPYTDNSIRKSALLTAAKKAKLKNNPSRVRFAECVTVNMVNGGSPPQHPSHLESYVPFMPNVLKVFLENGQTKSFKYDNKTTVKDVVYSLQEKLSIKKIQHFNLVLLNIKSHMPNRVTLLQEHETLAEIASKPGARHFRCLFRVMFVPRDPYDLLKEDPVAFEYFYLQCCNDVVNDRFPDLKGDTILKLAALQIQQHAMSSNASGKINLKAIEKECGLEKFVPVYERSTMKGKDLRKLLTQQLKMNQNLTAPGQKHLTALQAKLHYMKIVSEQKTFGSRVFMVTLLDKKTEAMVLVGPKSGISLITNIKNYSLSLLADFEKLKKMKVAKEKENMQKVEISLSGDEQQTLNIGLLKQDTQNFVTMVEGYYRIFVDPQKSLSEKPASKQTADPLGELCHLMRTNGSKTEVNSIDLESQIFSSAEYNRRTNGSKTEVNSIDLESQIFSSAEYNRRTNGSKTEVNSIDLESQIFSSAEYNRRTNGSKTEVNSIDLEIPVYTTSKHRVIAAPWSYPEDIVSQVIGIEDSEILENQRVVDCRRGPPNYEESQEYIKQIKEDLGIEGENKENGPMDTGIISLVQDDSENNNVQKDDKPKNKSVILIGKEPDTLINYTNKLKRPGEETSPKVSDKIPKKSDDSIDQGYQNGSLFETSEIKPPSSDELSDTDSGVESEKKIVIGELGPPDSHPGDVESVDSDSDSWGHPSSSPEKVDGLSFGIHNPDELPRSETDFQVIASSFGLLSPDKIPPGIEDGILDPRMFSERKLFIDPDIIDLTLLPPPTSHDQDETMTTWQPSLTSSLPIGYDVQKDTESKKPHHPPLFERSASMGDNPDFLDDDIDSFIASMMIPPPPDSCMTNNSSHNLADSLQFHFEDEDSQMYNGADSLISSDELLNSLVIPPPPGEVSESIDEIKIVPPVDSEMSDSKHSDSMKKRYSHRRSSSLDVSSLRSFNESLTESESKTESSPKSCDKNITPPKSLLTAPNAVKDFESPATVSEKLNILLQSMPSFGNVSESDMKFRRTSSLRLGKSASFEVLNSPPNEQEVIQSKKVARSNSFQVLLNGQQSVQGRSAELPPKKPGPTYISPKKNRPADPIKKNEESKSPEKSDNNSKYSRHLRRTHSFDIIPKKDNEKSTSDKSGGDNFASLKAKLKSYRDYLLSKSDDTKQRKSSLTSTDITAGSVSSESNSPLKRSNSFTFNWLKRRSNSLDSLDTRKNKETESGQSNSSKESEESAKKVPQVLSTLTLPRSTFKPHSTLSVQGTAITNSIHTEERQRNAQKKSGPMKALSSVLSSGDKKHSKDSVDSESSIPVKVSNGNIKHEDHNDQDQTTSGVQRPRRNSQRRGSKDDISGTYTPKSSTKGDASPFGTLGSNSSIWRPMSMRGKSTIKDDSEEARSYTNFDALRDITAEKLLRERTKK